MSNRKFCAVKPDGRVLKTQKCVMAKDRKEAAQKLKGIKGKILEVN